MFPVTTRTPILKLGPSITNVSFVRCPLLHLLPWLDTSCAAVIGPRSYGLCWWSQRVRKAGGRGVPVHHPVKDSLPRRRFVEQRTHIIAAWVRPTERASEGASERATGAGGQSRPEHRTHEAAVKLRYVPDQRGALAFKSDLVNFCSSPVMESRASPAWFHVPMLVYFPGCTADSGWKFCSFPSFHLEVQLQAPSPPPLPPGGILGPFERQKLFFINMPQNLHRMRFVTAWMCLS